METSSQYTDRQLFTLIAEGDELAFGQLFHLYNKQLLPYITALVKSDSDAREIMQEVFLKVWLNRGRLEEVDNPGGWLRTVASNVAYDHLRKQARYELQLNKVETGSISQTTDEFWQQFDAKQARTLIYEAIRKLPLRRRQIFQMSKIEGFSRSEIAEQLNISENTVRNQLVDAVEFVQEYLRSNHLVLVPLSVLLLTVI